MREAWWTNIQSINLMQNKIHKTDADIKCDVLSELEYEPNVKSTDIGVVVHHGNVTLSGSTGTYSAKWEAVNAAKRVAGVNAIADDIEVKLLHSHVRTDSDIALAITDQLQRAWTQPADSIKVTVRDGWITLEGELEWWYQKYAAEQLLRHLTGVKGVLNNISMKPRLAPAEIETAINEAFKRSALLDAAKIDVTTTGTTVTLTGQVRNHAEKDDAERAAWSAPGVFQVDNQLSVKWSLFA